MNTDLFQAVRRDGASAAIALAAVPDINVRNAEGQNLLHTAIAYANQSAISELLRLGIDVNAQDSKGQTPLHYAATYQNVDTAEQILSNGGNLSLVDLQGNSALWCAVFNARGKYGVVEVLLRHGGHDFSGVKNKHGKSPIDFATQIGDKQLVALLE